MELPCDDSGVSTFAARVVRGEVISTTTAYATGSPLVSYNGILSLRSMWLSAYAFQGRGTGVLGNNVPPKHIEGQVWTSFALGPRTKQPDLVFFDVLMMDKMALDGSSHGIHVGIGASRDTAGN